MIDPNGILPVDQLVAHLLVHGYVAPRFIRMRKMGTREARRRLIPKAMSLAVWVENVRKVRGPPRQEAKLIIPEIIRKNSYL